MHDVLAVAITVATILVAAYFNNQAVRDLRAEMIGLRLETRGDNEKLRSETKGENEKLRSEINGKLDIIIRDQREFYAQFARHEERIGHLETRK